MNPASQDRTCPVRTALHMALRGMGSRGDGSEVEGDRKGEEGPATSGCVFVKVFVLQR